MFLSRSIKFPVFTGNFFDYFCFIWYSIPMRKSVFFVGFDYQLIKKISMQVSDSLDMYFLDINDLIAYNIKKSDVIEKIGIEYYDKEIKKIVLSACSYENTIVNIPYDLFSQKDYYTKITQNNFVVYIRQDIENLQNKNQNISDKKMDVALLVFEELDKIIIKNSNKVVDFKNYQDVIKVLSKILKNLY